MMTRTRHSLGAGGVIECRWLIDSLEQCSAIFPFWGKASLSFLHRRRLVRAQSPALTTDERQALTGPGHRVTVAVPTNHDSTSSVAEAG